MKANLDLDTSMVSKDKFTDLTEIFGTATHSSMMEPLSLRSNLMRMVRNPIDHLLSTHNL